MNGRKLVLQLIGIILFLDCYSQDTLKLYLDNNFVRTETENATIKRIAIVKDNHYYVTDQFIDGRMINYGEYKSVNPWIEDGLSIHYNSDGLLYATGNYKNGQLEGNWIYGIDSRADTVNYQTANHYYNFVKDTCGLRKQLRFEDNAVSEKLKVSILEFLETKTHLPAKCRTIDAHNGVTIDMVIDTDGLVKCPFISDSNPDLDLEILRVLLNYHYDGPIRKRIRIITPFTIMQFGDTDEVGEWFVDVNASFQGKDLNAFSKWVQSQLVYPSEASALGIQGNVFVQFSVNSIGDVCDVKVVRNVHPLLDNEAIRMVRSSPKWTPALKNKINVKQNFVIPVAFQLR
jgi:TonB family protein